MCSYSTMGIIRKVNLLRRSVEVDDNHSIFAFGSFKVGKACSIRCPRYCRVGSGNSRDDAFACTMFSVEKPNVTHNLIGRYIGSSDGVNKVAALW